MILTTHSPKDNNERELKQKIISVLGELGKRLLPSIASHCINPMAGFIVSAFIFVSWRIYNERKSLNPVSELQGQERKLIELREKIREIQDKIKLWKSALEQAEEYARNAIINEIKILETRLKELQREYDMEYIRYRLWQIAKYSGSTEVIRVLKEFEDKLIKGGEFSAEEKQVIQELDKMYKEKYIDELKIKNIVDSLSNSVIGSGKYE